MKSFEEEKVSIEFVIEDLRPEYIEKHIKLYKPFLEDMSLEAQSYYKQRMKEKYGVDI